ncbi:heterokaryon incompatibility protein 6, OR allele [Rhypophila decipiens]|uniref:Heterokaryon incompatibility protein 6, OR allele n=1 Tax=Rhypophila decipiens TaxID=261697 RepID=A0AAN6YE64_9PEZI|nr:heterokaryon incompatibility protein 6, OR allele [Rhypophila decipiens]
MTQLLSPEFFKAAYDGLENDLERRSQDNEICKYCTEKDIASIFKPNPNGPSISEIKKPHGRLNDLPARKQCPFCRVICHLMERGAGDNCCGDCRSCYSPKESPDVDIDLRICPQPHRRVGAVAVLNIPDDRYCNYHIAHGDLHFVHPTQADHFRIREWITTCDSSHASCTEHIRAPDSLFGHGKFALRLIDVELRMIVKSLRPVRYITLSYVWGASANRKFEMIPNPYPEKSRYRPGIEPVDRQIPDMMFGRLSRTFEDLICFARRLGERYIWVDAICIPQDEPDILIHQLGLMDQIYFHGVCNIVSLTSGVEDGLPGTSSASPRNTSQLVEQFPDGSRIATPLWELYPLIQYAPWITRGWTLQEHLLAKRSIFFAPNEAIFVCKQMSAKESWRYPRTAADVEPNDKAERWYEYNTPLPSGPCVDPTGPDLTSTLSTIVHMYTSRQLTYASDKYRAFQGLEARLSETYGVKFLHGHPLSSAHLGPSLLWGRVDFRDGNQLQQPESAPINESDYPSWSWLGHPSAVTYKYWGPWADYPDFPTHGPLNLPTTELQIESVSTTTRKWYSLPDPDPSPKPSILLSNMEGGNGNYPLLPRILKIKALSLDVNPTEWPLSQRRNLPNAMSLWDNKSFLTPGRGQITFNLVVVPDDLPPGRDPSRAFCQPSSTTTSFKNRIRLIHVGGNSDDDLKPKMPLLLRRGEPARQVPPIPSANGETEFSRLIDWVEPDYTARNNYFGVEPDVCLLIVEAVNDSTVVVRRLGIAFVRTMDFLVAGAEVREVLLG